MTGAARASDRRLASEEGEARRWHRRDRADAPETGRGPAGGARGRGRDCRVAWPDPVFTYENALVARASITGGKRLGAEAGSTSGPLVGATLVERDPTKSPARPGGPARSSQAERLPRVRAIRRQIAQPMACFSRASRDIRQGGWTSGWSRQTHQATSRLVTSVLSGRRGRLPSRSHSATSCGWTRAREVASVAHPSPYHSHHSRT